MNCSKCFAEIADGVKFCKKCGNAVVQSSGPMAATPPTPEYQAPPPTYQPPPQEHQPPPGYPPQGHQPPPSGYPTEGYQPPPSGYPPGGYHQPASGYPPHGYPPPPKPPRVHYAPGSYAELAHESGGSILFLIGICLFTAGHVFSAFTNLFAGNWLGFLVALLLALPITAFWLIFASSKVPKLPEKTLPALTCFKVYVIINFVIMCILALILLIAGALLFMAGADMRFGATTLYLLGVVCVIAAGVIVTIHVLYLRAILGVLDSIRQSFYSNIMAPLKGIGTFTVLTYISVGLTVFGSITTAVIAFQLRRALALLPDFFLSFIDFPSMAPVILDTIFTLVICGGIVVCVVALNMFNNKILSRGAYPRV